MIQEEKDDYLLREIEQFIEFIKTVIHSNSKDLEKVEAIESLNNAFEKFSPGSTGLLHQDKNDLMDTTISQEMNILKIEAMAIALYELGVSETKPKKSQSFLKRSLSLFKHYCNNTNSVSFSSLILMEKIERLVK